MSALQEQQKGGDFAKASQTAESLIEVGRKQFGATHNNFAVVLSQAATVYFNTGDFLRSRNLFQEAHDILSSNSDSGNLRVAKIQNSLSAVYQELGNYDQAEEWSASSLRMRRELLDKDDPTMAAALVNYAAIKWHLGDTVEAAELYGEAYRIRKNSLSPTDTALASVTMNLGTVLSHLGEYQKAGALLEKSQSIFREADDQVNEAANRQRLGDLHWFEGEYDDALDHYNACLEIRKSFFGTNHVEVGRCLVKRGRSQLALGEVGQAIDDLEKGIGDMKRALGDNHPDLIEPTSLHAWSLFRRGQKTEAEKKLEEHLEILYHCFDEVIQYAPEAERLTFMKRFDPFAGPVLLERGDLLMECSARVKGKIMESLARERRMEERLQRAEPALFNEIQDLRMLIYQISLSEGEGSDQAVLLKKSLEAKETEVARFLGDADPQGFFDLQEGEVTLDFVTYRSDPSRYRSPEHYAAGVYLKNSQRVHFISDTESLNESIAVYRQTLVAVVTDNLDRPFEEMERIFLDAHTKLSGELLAPLKGELPKRLFVCADGQLHFVDFFSLISGESVIGALCDLSIVDSVRRARARDVISAGKPSILLIYNPDYSDQTPTNSNVVKGRGAVGGSEGSDLGQLEGTITEAQLIQKLAGESSVPVSMATDGRASEAFLKQNVKNHSVIHLATHGFFLEGRFEEGERARNPMALSGLAFAGAGTTLNLWQENLFPEPGVDGILSAAEVSFMDLDQTNLVVLSACDTATGKAENGEGVVGLRKAMKLAGTRNVLMTLWPVEDSATGAVMETFYTEYFKNRDAESALRKAKREQFMSWKNTEGLMIAVLLVGPFFNIQH